MPSEQRNFPTTPTPLAGSGMRPSGRVSTPHSHFTSSSSPEGALPNVVVASVTAARTTFNHYLATCTTSYRDYREHLAEQSHSASFLPGAEAQHRSAFSGTSCSYPTTHVSSRLRERRFL